MTKISETKLPNHYYYYYYLIFKGYFNPTYNFEVDHYHPKSSSDN